MLKKLILENWKSFRYAELPIDPLTVLIGTNASGKSNVVEALEFLQRIARDKYIEDALAGDSKVPPIRGSVKWASHKPETQFTLKALIQGEDDRTDYLYSITVDTKTFAYVVEEYLISQKYQIEQEKCIQNYLVKTYPSSNQSPDIHLVDNAIKIIKTNNYSEADTSGVLADNNTVKIMKMGGESPIDLSILNILKSLSISSNIKNKINIIIQAIENIFILNPIPSKMRNYSSLSETFESDASNIAGVLAALPDEQKAEIEATISTYIKDLPEGDIQRIWAEKVGRFGTDAMLYCEEQWKPGHITEIDARSMSDGTLRFLAILTALLTRPENSQLVIEEIDNGLHPSRAQLLVRMLREIGAKRKIDILVTTHNPALLDVLGPEIVPFVVVAHRDSETGESQLTVVEDIQNFPKLFASASLGKLTTTGAIERSLSRNE
jgi:AAA15 family ATPase/GTPase